MGDALNRTSPGAVASVDTTTGYAHWTLRRRQERHVGRASSHFTWMNLLSGLVGGAAAVLGTHLADFAVLAALPRLPVSALRVVRPVCLVELVVGHGYEVAGSATDDEIMTFAGRQV